MAGSGGETSGVTSGGGSGGGGGVAVAMEGGWVVVDEGADTIAVDLNLEPQRTYVYKLQVTNDFLGQCVVVSLISFVAFPYLFA
jgi:hypothetical protein